MKKITYNKIQAQKDLPFRQKTDNKTRGGKCLVAAGQAEQWGAAILCSEAVARVGAGYTYVYDPKKTFPTLKFPDFLTKYSQKDLSVFHAFALGPGLKNSLLIKNILRQLIKLKASRVVLDAEALNVLAKMKKPFSLPPTWILTPHEGEMARLLNIASSEIKTNREKSLLTLQKKMGCIVLLKGSPSLISDGKSIYRINSGNSALAKAGTGDVLTGIIAGFLSQNVSPLRAACLGTFLHGFIADQWLKKKKDHLSLLATDLLKDLPSSLYRLRGAS